MVAKGGHPLINNNAIMKLKKIIKISSLVTPNIPEAEILSGMKINNTKDMIMAANKLLKLGAENILIKGGHMKGKKVNDVFLNKSGYKIFMNKKELNLRILMAQDAVYQVQLQLILRVEKNKKIM